MSKTYCTRKSMELLRKYVENDGFRQMEVSEMLDWFLWYKKTYLVAMPRTNGRWTAWVIIINKPNKIDGLLNMVDIELNCKTKVDAEKKGIEWVLQWLVDAKEKVKTMTDEEIEKSRQNCIKAGFDLTDL